WRRGWDSNPRSPCGDNGFQDRHHRPLGHPSGFEVTIEYYTKEAEQKLVDDSACIPLWFGQNHILVKSYIEGYDLNPMGFAMLNEVSID
ncbi:unnamed protein product, partial [marine sediment metagenome]